MFGRFIHLKSNVKIIRGTLMVFYLSWLPVLPNQSRRQEIRVEEIHVLFFLSPRLTISYNFSHQDRSEALQEFSTTNHLYPFCECRFFGLGKSANRKKFEGRNQILVSDPKSKKIRNEPNKDVRKIRNCFELKRQKQLLVHFKMMDLGL